MLKFARPKIALALAAALTTTGCLSTGSQYTREQGVVGGALSGAAVAILLGENPAEGAVVGAAAGYLTGSDCVITSVDGYTNIIVNQNGQVLRRSTQADGAVRRCSNGNQAQQRVHNNYYSQPRYGARYGGPAYRPFGL